jgi:hypothetical protein
MRVADAEMASRPTIKRAAYSVLIREEGDSTGSGQQEVGKID